MQQLHDVLSMAIRGMSTEELSRHAQGKWSAAQILEHLNLTYSGTIKNMERQLSEPVLKSTSNKAGFWRRLLVTRLGFFPRGRKSPERVAPRGMPAEQVTREILQNLARMDEVISLCEARVSRRVPIADHPILGALTAAEWRGFHLTHGKHHARQIFRLRKSA